MRWLVVCAAIGCGPPPGAPLYPPPGPPEPLPPPEPITSFDPATVGQVVTSMYDFAFDGGRIEFQTRQDGYHVYEVARNHYAVAVTIQWQLVSLDNLEPTAPVRGVTVLPPARTPSGEGPPVVLTTLQILDRRLAFHREMQFHARFGDPRARPDPSYAYRLPYRAGKTFAVLQGFHGAFSHRGSNEYAIDFDCPVATHVVAARPGIIVAANAAAQGSGTTQDYLEYSRTNFVFVLHDDGTLGEYMHLAPSGVEVQVGQRVDRGDELALSGNTGFSSTPHLHFQVMTAGEDGVSAQSFPFVIAVAPGRTESPVEGRSYPSWE